MDRNIIVLFMLILLLTSNLSIVLANNLSGIPIMPSDECESNVILGLISSIGYLLCVVLIIFTVIKYIKLKKKKMFH